MPVDQVFKRTPVNLFRRDNCVPEHFLVVSQEDILYQSTSVSGVLKKAPAIFPFAGGGCRMILILL